jgi:hypothetical protein
MSDQEWPPVPPHAPPHALPQASPEAYHRLLLEYPHAAIDRKLRSVVYPDGREVPLQGQTHLFLDFLLDHPDTIQSYWDIAQVVIPEYCDPQYRDPTIQSWHDLSRHEQAAVKRSLWRVAHHARRMLGETRTERSSMILNRAGWGYGIRHWLAERKHR